MVNKNEIFRLFICSMLFFALFLFQTPRYSAASFSDSVSVDAGIELTLGNVKLEDASSDLRQSVSLSADSPEQTLLTTTLRNAGSLDGKIGYRLDGSIPNTVAAGVTLALYEGDEYVADLELGKDSFIEKGGEPVVIEPGSQKNYSVKVKSAMMPDATENFELSIAFSLTQTNASDPKQMFHDEAQFDPIAIVLEAENLIPGWPLDSDPRWKFDSKTGVRYINELETEIMYYGETKDGTRIKNLDDLSIYIDYSKSNQKWNFKQISKLDPPFNVKEEWSDGKVRVDVSLDADVNQYMHSTTISDYDYDMKFQFQSNNNKVLTFKGSLFAKRLLLTTDNADYHNNAEYRKDVLPIYTSKQDSVMRLAYIQNNTYSPLASLSESPLQLSAYRIRFEAQKADAMIAKVDKSTNSFKVKVADFVSDLDEIKRLTIFITGTSGEELKIERNVKALPIDPYMQIPTDWYDIGGNNQVKISSQELNIPVLKKPQGNTIYYVSDEGNPPVLYLMNTGNHYFDFRFPGQAEMINGLRISEIVYSPNLKIMKVTFSFESINLPDGFNFSLSNGINDIISGSYYKFNFIRNGQNLGVMANTLSASESLQTSQTPLQSEPEAAQSASVETTDEGDLLEAAPEEAVSQDEAVGVLSESTVPESGTQSE